MTVRYLQCAVFLFVSLGSLTSDSSNLFGTLDLGGGSTQITLNPVDQVNTCACRARATVKFLICY